MKKEKEVEQAKWCLKVVGKVKKSQRRGVRWGKVFSLFDVNCQMS